MLTLGRIWWIATPFTTGKLNSWENSWSAISLPISSEDLTCNKVFQSASCAYRSRRFSLSSSFAIFVIRVASPNPLLVRANLPTNCNVIGNDLYLSWIAAIFKFGISIPSPNISTHTTILASPDFKLVILSCFSFGGISLWINTGLNSGNRGA